MSHYAHVYTPYSPDTVSRIMDLGYTRSPPPLQKGLMNIKHKYCKRGSTYIQLVAFSCNWCNINLTRHLKRALSEVLFWQADVRASASPQSGRRSITSELKERLQFWYFSPEVQPLRFESSYFIYSKRESTVGKLQYCSYKLQQSSL